MATTKRKTYEEVKKVFEDRGYKLLSTEYINNKTKLKYICPNNHIGEIIFDSFKQGSGCRICGISKAAKKNKTVLLNEANKKRMSFEKVKKEFEEHGFKLLSTEYKNNQTKLEYICPNGHKGITTYKSFHKHHGCKQCANEKVGEKSWKNRKKSIEDVREIFKKRGYTLLSTEYIDSKQKLDFICPEGHKYFITLNSFMLGRGCRICSQYRNSLQISGTSKAEEEIFDFVKQYFPDTIQHNRTIITPYELDIIIPSKKVAIEYCGLYWHSEQQGKDRYYHYNKWNKCREVGYNLITIFEDEWIWHKDIVLSRLSNILGIHNQKVVFARKCNIKEIDSKLKNKFLDENHLQGRDKSNIKVGAFIGDELISVMTFSTPSIAKGMKFKKGVFELNRFCSKKDIVCTGIASRLFKYFVTNYKPKEVYSYADIRWSVGDLYYKLNFNFDKFSNPNYWYVQDQKRIHRFNFRKSVLSKKLDEFNPDLTEVENMINNGYIRIWDCGNMKFKKVF